MNIDEVVDDLWVSIVTLDAYASKDKIKEILCDVLIEQCDSILEINCDSVREWENTATYNFLAPEKPLADRIVKMVMNKSDNNIFKMKEAIENSRPSKKK